MNWREEARVLARDGVKKGAIAEHFGKHRNTVRLALNEEAREEDNRRRADRRGRSQRGAVTLAVAPWERRA